MSIPSNVKNRIEDLALMHGVPVDNLEAGVKEAVQVWTRFVQTLPDHLKTPVALTQLISDNYEIVYSLIEAAGLAVGNENNALRDELSELEAISADAVRGNMMMLSVFHKHHKTYAYQVETGGFIDSDEDDADDDSMHMPAWRVTIVLKGSHENPKTFERVTTHVTHATFAQLFRNAEIVDWNPDPEADAPYESAEISGFKSSAAVDVDEDTPL